MSEMVRNDADRPDQALPGPEQPGSGDCPVPPETDVAGFERVLRRGSADGDCARTGERARVRGGGHPGRRESGGGEDETGAALISLFSGRFSGGETAVDAAPLNALADPAVPAPSGRSANREHRDGPAEIGKLDLPGRDGAVREDRRPEHPERRKRTEREENGIEREPDPAPAGPSGNPDPSAPRVAAPARAEDGPVLPDVNDLVQRVLVSRPENGVSEIRLSLHDTILPGAEIRLSLGADGILSVVLIAGGAAAFQTLVAARGDLQERLEGYGQEVRVSVTMDTDGQSDDTNRRSAGYRDWSGSEEEDRRSGRV